MVVLGAESTGKTTLCSGLAGRLGVPFIPEFGRHYTEAMPRPSSYEWQEQDFIVIAATQNRFEDDAARWLDGPMVCDTNAFVTGVFCEAYTGSASEAVAALAAQRRYDLVLLCDPDTPFEQDSTTGLRRDGEQRRWMHEQYLSWAASQGSPWELMVGAAHERVERAAQLVQQLLATR